MTIVQPDLEDSARAGRQLSPKQPGVLARWTRTIEPSAFIWIGATLILVFLVVAPMLRLLVSSFQLTDSGAFTLMNYVTAYYSERRLIALGNSLLYGAAVVAVSIGC